MCAGGGEEGDESERVCAGGGEEGDEGEGCVSMCTGGRTSVWVRGGCAFICGAFQ